MRRTRPLKRQPRARCVCLQAEDALLRACCAAQDIAGNLSNSAECTLVTSDPAPPQLQNVTVSCLDTTVAGVSLVADQPSDIAYFVLPSDAAVADPSTLQASSFFASTEQVGSGSVASGTAVVTNSLDVQLAACNLDAAESYVLYLASRGKAESQLFGAVLAVAFNMTTVCSAPKSFQCEPGRFVDALQPRLRVVAGPGMLVGATAVKPTPAGLSIAQVSP